MYGIIIPLSVCDLELVMAFRGLDKMRKNCLAAGTPRLHWESICIVCGVLWKARSSGASAIIRSLRKRLQYMNISVFGSLLCAPNFHKLVNCSPPQSS
jgi:hypothetical protein